MKTKSQFSKVLLVLIPFLMLIISMTIDYLEPILTKYLYRIWKPDLVMWLWSLDRVVFVLVIFAGVLYFINAKHKAKFHSIVWLALGFLSMFASTPWGHLFRRPVFFRSSFFLFFPRSLFFVAGAFLLVTGLYCLLRPDRNHHD